MVKLIQAKLVMAKLNYIKLIMVKGWKSFKVYTEDKKNFIQIQLFFTLYFDPHKN
jgi:hypothetical protein